MERHFQRDLENLKIDVIKMGSIVEQNIIDALDAVLKQNKELAKKVIASDGRVNSFEIQIDNGVVDLLALQQPVASDLRLILAIQKINNDLERIGDHAVNIAESALAIIESKQNETLLEIPNMAAIAKEMFQQALDSFIHLHPQQARLVLESDDRIDTLNRSMISEVVSLIKTDQRSTEGCLQLLRISRNLERIADLTTNIAEEVIFHTEARVVKHHAEEG
ncbi:MAG: phosphate signaling complex protein PhoU [Bacteroidota bacterium]|nr:phosphate signaling complex protein PhoU [Bacteroidota bacterium]